jgi:hypothetical protein
MFLTNTIQPDHARASVQRAAATEHLAPWY